MKLARIALMALAFISGLTFTSMTEALAQGGPRVMPRSMSNFGMMRRPRLIQRWYTATNVGRNQCSFSKTGTLQADTGESGHLAATRFQAPVSPFWVREIRYGLIHGYFDVRNANSDCDGGIGHRVEVYIGNELNPDDEPRLVATLLADEDDFDEDDVAYWPNTESFGVYTWRHTLPRPVVLRSGEYLFVAIEMVGERGEVQMCAQWCVDNVAAGKSTWSFATEPPYRWESLDPYMRWDGDLNIQVRGTR